MLDFKGADKPEPLPYEFLIRPCYAYKDEGHECERPKGRFHQYFIFGHLLDCTQWHTDYSNCLKWKKSRDMNAYNQLIKSETKRMRERMQGHYNNDVWKKRDKPPDNWNDPLPDWLEKKNANTYLALKAKDIREGTVNDLEAHIYEAVTCSIL